MELYQIRYFLAVADTLNFTRASERSFVSLPALTKAIQRLEQAVGGRLFDRAKTPVQLTELGQAMLPSLRQIHLSAMRTDRDAFNKTHQCLREYERTGRLELRVTRLFPSNFLQNFAASVSGI